MDSSGFSSPRPDLFPAGLRVLVVDDDPTWLKILEKMLKKCNYEVTTCNLAREALDLLRERKDGFDIVISDVNMPDMDGFKLLENVGLEMDLPVIMMSVDGETSRVMKGVQHGACDYLLKPIRMKELRNIWQHVFRKRIHEVRDIEGHESLDEMLMRNGPELSEDGFFFCGDLASGRKRKDVDCKNDDRLFGDSSTSKKARVVWTVDLHQKFVKAVNHIGFEKVGPKKILDLMGVPWLTRENVASHLQKYRLYLSRLQKDKEMKVSPLGGTTNSESLSPKDVSLKTPVTGTTSCLKQNTRADISVESKAALPGEMNDLSKSSTSSISLDHSFRQLTSDAKSEPKIQAQYSWSGGAPPPLQFKPEHKPHTGVPVPPVPFKHEQKPQGGAPPLQFKKEHRISDNPPPAATEPLYSKSKHNEKATKVESTAALFCVQPEMDSVPPSVWNNTKSQSLEENLYVEMESWYRNALVGTGSTLRLWEEEYSDYSNSQTDLYSHSPHIAAIDPFSFNNQDLISDFPSHLYDSIKFPIDPVEYPVIDQGVYIA